MLTRMPDPGCLRGHPITSTALEAFYDGSWHGINSMRVMDGNIWIQPDRLGSEVLEKVHGDNLRLRSRKANSSDCEHFLKPGTDVCVLSADSTGTPSEKGMQPSFSWQDAKIVSIKRTYHEYRCTCLYSIAVCSGRDSSGRETNGKIKAEIVKIDSIAILQKLKLETGDDRIHQWVSSEDCSSSTRSKLLGDVFSCEVSWLLVLSVLRGMEFETKLMNNMIVHCVLGSNKIPDDASTCEKAEVMVMRFQKIGDKLRPKFETIVPMNTMILYAHTNLRHSKRQRVLPQRLVPSFTQRSGSAPENIDSDSSQDERDEQYEVGDEEDDESDEDDDDDEEEDEEEEEDEIDELEKVDKVDNNSIVLHPSFNKDDDSKNLRKRKLLSVNECKQIIESCIEGMHANLDEDVFIPRKVTKNKKPRKRRAAPEVEFKTANFFPEDTSTVLVPEPEYFNWTSSSDSEPEEHEELWKDMAGALATLALLEGKQDLGMGFPSGDTSDSYQLSVHHCQHEIVEDVEIGQICVLCKCVFTEIRYVPPQLARGENWTTLRLNFDRDEFDWFKSFSLESDPFGKTLTSNDMALSDVWDDVWSLIPDYQPKLHPHQKKAFEFIWNNIAGSTNPEDMNHHEEDTGGCVISHSPGAGKTLLLITFLVSYLRLYPKCRPLILAPKTATCIWCREFEKWEVPIPLLQILAAESFRNGRVECKGVSPLDNRRPSRKMMHVMDCLSKFKRWLEQPSVLLMSYSSFFSMVQGEGKEDYRRFMADVLEKSPGILVLDEGHNPRSTLSKLRKLLMKVKTEFRILLSGTLFQNNFQEYFNTLSLARPRFIKDVIKDLDPHMTNVMNGIKRNRARKLGRSEKLARKLFVDQIGQKIESTDPVERKAGFDLLNRMTNRFLDAFEGDGLLTTSGLHIYTVSLASVGIQDEILRKVTKLHRDVKHRRCPLELELLMTVSSVHPSLIKTVACVQTFFDTSETDRLEQCKGNFRCGSKAEFVVDLVHKCIIREERVLLFCHNISPLNYFVELFRFIFKWQIGEEVLLLTGDQDISERARIIDQFNLAARGKCKILLASTNACAEGISLTAASRVILVDSEWNHAKTRQAVARAFRPGQQREVFVYRLLAIGTYEEDKHGTNAWKAWLSKMIFLGRYIDPPAAEEARDIEDDVLREIVEEDQMSRVKMITKHDRV